MFKRRETGWNLKRMLIALLSPMTWWRGAKYVGKRVVRLAGSPHSVAIGVSAGVFASFTPFIGLHFLLAFGLAWIFAGNMFAAALGTAIGNPLTFPIIWTSTYNVGSRFLYPESLLPISEFNLVAMLKHLDFAQLWDPFLKAMTIGALPIGGAFALLFYGLTYLSVRSFQTYRRQRLAKAKPADLSQ